MMAASFPLQYLPFSSAFEPGFWYSLTEKKLDSWRLDESSKPLRGLYSYGDKPGLPCFLRLEYSSLDTDKTCAPSPRFLKTHGILINFNTIDKFRECNKQDIINEAGLKIWSAIESGSAVQKPSLLIEFLLLTFSDLKKYHYYYWFAFPALSFLSDVSLKETPKQLGEEFSMDQIKNLVAVFDESCMAPGDIEEISFFVVVQTDEMTFEIQSLKSVTASLQTVSADRKVFFGFCDPSTDSGHPGWPLRNYLALIFYQWSSKLTEVNVLCWRDRIKDGERSVAHSLVLRLSEDAVARGKALSSASDQKGAGAQCPKVVGWEKNEKGRLGPRLVNMSRSMDPSRLAEASVDLNLRLMRWRLVPSLDLAALSATRCLLLGAGTLGCSVARNLMAWGVRKITLVDYGRVAFSNPVRQTLFTFEDSLDGGRPKAQAAAEALRRIFPGIDASGVQLSIPMPGHPVADHLTAQTRADVQQIERLIADHDVTFLLLDTRESRWLPTLIACSQRKLVINAALGFDTYMVVRHGVRPPRPVPTSSEAPNPTTAPTTGEELSSNNAPTTGEAPNPNTTPTTGEAPFVYHPETPIPGTHLGCYFCNDVVAPSDSTRDRTLDQQCTVSRPGMSQVAGALAVELLVSVLQHPAQGRAPASTSAKDLHLTEDLPTCLGLLPHQIRGFLSRFHQVMPASMVFDKCAACSDKVLKEYEDRGFEFLMDAFNQPTYLEDLTGLSQLHQETQEVEVWDYSDDESV